MIWLKIIGALITVFAFAEFGVYKSSKSKTRRDVLRKICLSLENLSIDIRLNKGELYPLIIKSFHEDYIKFENCRFSALEKYIKKSQLEKLNELVTDLGRSDAAGECEKIALYQGIFSDYLAEAEALYKTDRKLWNSLCIGGGISVVLLLI